MSTSVQKTITINDKQYEKVATYYYKNKNGTPLFIKVKYQSSDGEKTFRLWHLDNNKFIPGLGNCERILYRLPEILTTTEKGSTIVLVEGEKDADTLLQHSICATTAPTPEWIEEYTKTLENADVVILYDNDKAGLRRRDLLCKHLYGQVKRLRVVDLPGIEYRESHGQDITDWFEMGHTIDEFNSLVEQAPDYKPAVIECSALQKNKLNIITLENLLSIELPEREILLMPFLPSQGLVLLVAKRGVGKTHVALGIAYAVASGDTFLRWTAPNPKKVLYIDGEMPASLMQERLKIITSMSRKKPEPDFFKLITPDLQSHVIPDLATDTGRYTIEEYIQDCDLIVIDNISCLFRSGSENEAESWQQAQEWALDLRRRGKSVLFVHHAGKNGVQRGTSKREDILDAVIILKHPDDYTAEEGARFEVYFDKARHFVGEDASPFQARLIEESGIWRWELSCTPEEEQVIQIAQMKKNGFTIKEMCNKTKLTKAQIEWRLAKAKEKGYL